jgi:hypothetical protein
MRGLDVTEIFEEQPELELAPITETGQYMRKPPTRNHDPRVEIKGSPDFPLTERIADDIRTHGEEWTRQFHIARGVSRWELDILIAGAKASA